MSTFLMPIRTAWSDYFPAVPLYTLNSQFYNSRQNNSITGVYVLNCLFNSITSSSAGGALYCSDSVQYLLVESSSFFSCKTSGGDGGAIYFINTNNGQSVLKEVCSYDCCTTTSNYGVQFARVDVNNSVSSKNYVNYSSISRSVNTDVYYAFYLWNGKICCPSVNSSMNRLRYRSGISCWPSIDSNSVTCSLSYSTFADNYAAGFTCIFLNIEGAKYEIKSCNILRNTQGAPISEGTIYTKGNLAIENSCILENNANCNFFVSSPSCTITLSSCTVDRITYNQNLVTQSTVTKSFILALNHMSTRNCNAVYDVIRILTPIIHTPSASMKLRLYYTCENFLYQYRLSYLVSLISIFIFNSIHPYAFWDSLYQNNYLSMHN
jgi:hypothetical protein